jgi:hypothetical protein
VILAVALLVVTANPGVPSGLTSGQLECLDALEDIQPGTPYADRYKAATR